MSLMNNSNYVWYACYGSNLLEERFLCYIQGGKPKGGLKEYLGSRDKTPPIETEQIIIKNQLYFAKYSRTWQGAVAFISPNTNQKTNSYGRMYLITKEQFVDVLKQEIGLEGSLDVDFEAIIEKGKRIVKDKSWYGLTIFLGYHNEVPIFTFTYQDLLPSKTPSEDYLKIIIEGLKETYNFDNEEIAQYLSSSPGIADNFNLDQLLNLATRQ